MQTVMALEMPVMTHPGPMRMAMASMMTLTTAQP